MLAATLAAIAAVAVGAQDPNADPAPSTGQSLSAPPPAAAPAPPALPLPSASPASGTPIEGCVVVAFHILANGEPVEMQVVDSVPAGRFDKGAMKGIEKWRFGPQASCEGRYWQKLEFRTNPPGPPAARACIEPPAPDCKARPSAPGR
jgi:TonB family protein